MPLEATMICLDNSEWMRNGDYIPSRLEAQQDAANWLCQSKTNANAESTVGVLTMAGKSVQVLASPTENMGTLLGAVHRVSIGGALKFSNALQVAQLALKHRRTKTGGQRIFVFVGSPIEEDASLLTRMGKLLKKNNIAVEVLAMGDLEDNTAKLEGFVAAANSNGNSRLMTVPAGVLPSDVLRSAGDGDRDHGAGGGMADTAFGDVDPSMDPELALALRVSMEEERARQEAAQRRAAEESKQEEAAPAAAPVAAVAPQQEVAAPAVGAPPPAPQVAAPAPTAPAPASTTPFANPDFVDSIFSMTPGVDRNDPRIQAALAQMMQPPSQPKDESKEKENEDKKQ